MSRRLLLSLCTALLVALPAGASATEVWSGRTFLFTKAAFANPTQAANQDRITSGVWITRGSTQGIYNAKTESGYAFDVSPAGTEWATGDAANHASLVFKPWQIWCGSNPPASVGVNAVLHLIADDIYVDIRFESWGEKSGSGGFFSYTRGVPPSVPTAASTWARLKALYH